MVATPEQREQYFLYLMGKEVTPSRECARRGGVPEQFINTHFTRHEGGK